MPHIIILEEWCTSLAQLKAYCETIQTNIDNEVYESEDLAKALGIITSATTFIEAVDAEYRGALDDEIAGCEAFLGI